MKLNRVEEALKDLNNSIQIEPSMKAWMRRSQVRLELGQYADAFSDCKQAMILEPRNKHVWRILNTIETHDLLLAPEIQLYRYQVACQKLRVMGNPMPPCLTGHATCTIDDVVYMFGGRSAGAGGENQYFYCFDIEDRYWSSLETRGPAVPQARSWHTLNSVKPHHIIILFGGVSPRGEYSDMWLYHSRDQKWTPMLPTPGQEWPSARSGHSATIIPNTKDKNVYDMYVFGGRSKNGAFNELWRLSLIFKAHDSTPAIYWQQLHRSKNDQWPAARDGHSICWLTKQNQLIMYGGNGQDSREKLDDVWLLDLAKLTWLQQEVSVGAPKPRAYHSMHVVGAFVFVIGGRTYDGEENVVYALDTSSFRWYQVPVDNLDAFAARAWHSSEFCNDTILVFSGGGPSGPLQDTVALMLTGTVLLEVEPASV